MILSRNFISPITRKRLARFRKMRLAWIALWTLIALFIVSLGSEFLCNDKPLYVRYEGESYFPVFFYYPQDAFVPDGVQTRPNYKEINTLPQFNKESGNYMIFAPVAFGPYESIDPKSIETSDYVRTAIRPVPKVGTVNIKPDLTISRHNQAGIFFNLNSNSIKGMYLTDNIALSQALKEGIQQRFANVASPRISEVVQDARGVEVTVSLSTFRQRSRAPSSVRLTIKETGVDKKNITVLSFSTDLIPEEDNGYFWKSTPQDAKEKILVGVKSMFDGYADPISLQINGQTYEVEFKKDEVRFPYPPTRRHLMGIDSAGRDVLARILYGLRTSLSFGLILVVVSMVLGTMAGAIQGYYGGRTDIAGQRMTEIWSAIPFLYVMILLGSVYGRSFSLLLVCYAIFNWISISYYMRAEFLRLRKQAFVESAKCMGIPDHKIMLRHILPNGLVPIITFFPFFLVGAIGALAALDYLGFGLPPPTPSWGELLSQAQSYRWAWWLILYPSLALFVVMLLGVFIGEGVRNAFDPKQYSRLK